jgi:hypothetical protein
MERTHAEVECHSQTYFLRDRPRIEFGVDEEMTDSLDNVQCSVSVLA